MEYYKLDLDPLKLCTNKAQISTKVFYLLDVFKLYIYTRRGMNKSVCPKKIRDMKVFLWL